MTLSIGNTSSGNSTTEPHTVPVTSNYIMAIVAINASSTPHATLTATFDGDAMDIIGYHDHPTATDLSIYIFGLEVSGDGTSKNLVFTPSKGLDHIRSNHIDFGYTTTGNMGTVATDSTLSATQSALAVSAETVDIVIAGLYTSVASAHTPLDGQTEINDDSNFVGGYDTSPATTQNMRWSWSGSSVSISIGVAVKEKQGGYNVIMM